MFSKVQHNLETDTPSCFYFLCWLCSHAVPLLYKQLNTLYPTHHVPINVLNFSLCYGVLSLEGLSGFGGIGGYIMEEFNKARPP